MTRRAPVRERTLLASLNSIQVTAQVALGEDKPPVKVFSKNKHKNQNITKEAGPAHEQAPAVFMEMGGKGDQVLFTDDSSSIYPTGDTAAKTKGKGKGK
jgi:serine/threonine-protein kinase Chk2